MGIAQGAANIEVGTLEERMMFSEMHTVADILFYDCGQIVSWKFVAAHEKNHKYKEGNLFLKDIFPLSLFFTIPRILHPQVALLQARGGMPVAFADFEGIDQATTAMNALQGISLPSSD